MTCLFENYSRRIARLAADRDPTPAAWDLSLRVLTLIPLVAKISEYRVHIAYWSKKNEIVSNSELGRIFGLTTK